MKGTLPESNSQNRPEKRPKKQTKRKCKTHILMPDMCGSRQLWACRSPVVDPPAALEQQQNRGAPKQRGEHHPPSPRWSWLPSLMGLTWLGFGCLAACCGKEVFSTHFWGVFVRKSSWLSLQKKNKVDTVYTKKEKFEGFFGWDWWIFVKPKRKGQIKWCQMKKW